LDILGNPELISLNALRNISTDVMRIDVYDNASLVQMDFGNITGVIGFNLNSYGYFIIEDNPLLTSLGDLSSLTEVNNFIRIWGNTSLIDFCGLQPLLEAGGLTNADELDIVFEVIANGYNPTIENIINGDCSQ
jgi:hypothetical protein